MLAVNQGHEVGVDIEFAKADFEFLDVASHFSTKQEVTALRALPPALQRQAFYKCWTSKEAFLEDQEPNLSGELDEVEDVLVGEHVQIKASVAGWSLVELPPSGGYEAALVTRSKPVKIFCYHWNLPW